MAQIRAIRKRMTAVGTIARITKTMQMIATAKFTAALSRAKDSRPYTNAIRNLVGEVSGAAGDYDSPLFSAPASTAGKELLLVITSDRGLCGAYNGNVLRKALVHTRGAKQNNSEVTLETAGKKATTFFKFQKLEARNQLTFGDKPMYEDVARVAKRYMEEFTNGEWEKVSIAYMRFESNARQIPEVIQLLPLSTEKNEAEETETSSANYEFSPSAGEILDDLIPKSVITTLFQMFNDAVVSENIMRMIAMKSATENANDLGKDLKRDYNRARQAQITTELTEIISGAAALE